MYAPFLGLPVPALSKEQTMEQFMGTMLELQRKQVDLTLSVAVAHLNDHPIPTNAIIKQSEDLHKLLEKAEALRGAHAKR